MNFCKCGWLIQDYFNFCPCCGIQVCEYCYHNNSKSICGCDCHKEDKK